MEKENAFKFLVFSAIPCRRNKSGKIIEPQDRLKDAIHRAHRDVLSGRFYFEQYLSYKEKGKDGLNEIEIKLDSIIRDLKKKGIALNSNSLIETLQKEYDTVEFGAIQKLVNMTLKYVVILNSFEKAEIPVDEHGCDCPLDSVILTELEKRLGKKHTKWTRMNHDEYKEVQKEIKQIMENEPILYFDFKYWK